MNRRSVLTGAGLAALIPATSAAAIRSKLPVLIAAHRIAYQAFSDCRDDQWNKEWKRLSDTEEEAVLAILCHRPVSVAEARAKVEYLGPMNRKHELPDWSFDALLESLLPEGEKLPDTFTNWDLHYVGGAK